MRSQSHSAQHLCILSRDSMPRRGDRDAAIRLSERKRKTMHSQVEWTLRQNFIRHSCCCCVYLCRLVYNHFSFLSLCLSVSRWFTSILGCNHWRFQSTSSAPRFHWNAFEFNSSQKNDLIFWICWLRRDVNAISHYCSRLHLHDEPHTIWSNWLCKSCIVLFAKQHS